MSIQIDKLNSSKRSLQRCHSGNPRRPFLSNMRILKSGFQTRRVQELHNQSTEIRNVPRIIESLQAELLQPNTNDNERAEVFHLLAELQQRLCIETERSAQSASNLAQQYNLLSDLGGAVVFLAGEQVDMSQIPGYKTPKKDALEALMTGTQVFQNPKTAHEHQVKKLVEASDLLLQSLENYDRALALYKTSPGRVTDVTKKKAALEKIASPLFEKTIDEIMSNPGILWDFYTPRTEMIGFYERYLPFIREKEFSRPRETNLQISEVFDPQRAGKRPPYLKDKLRVYIARLLLNEADSLSSDTNGNELKKELLLKAKGHIEASKVNSPNFDLTEKIGSWVQNSLSKLAS